MTLFLSIPEYLSQYPDAAELQQAIRQPWSIPLNDATGRSYGYRQDVNLRPGLSVLIDDYTLQDDLIVELSSSQGYEPARLGLEMSFLLSGHNRAEGVQVHHNFLDVSWDSSDGGQFDWQAGERILKLDIHIEPYLFETLVGEQLEALPCTFCELMRNPQFSHKKFRQVAPTTATMQTALHQILHCPYQGLTRWLFWESKVLELIALRLDQMSQSSAPLMTPNWSTDDVDRIHYASSILLKHLVDPPSLEQLAQLAGLNDRKLKEGFRQVFGTTVFGYLTQYRMEKACQLLRQQQSVAAVAIAVGYASPTAFSGTFRRRFGMSPKGYQVAKRRRYS
ncbi:Regulatory protein PchR [Acaryochloris thomasi RCC1774]|uniref:Regulatory protein PchR n=1 Tax=Acaryochloris thomasi RCC1774 TaxID=1764569 RepID=A0A2W1JGU0_9CYAN|nr:AraC family transcriptional regulator [Acaryochloris thomasi]PZD72606.1 Regulatory protein PchR [Acaryochloris thomasi RCC1774]